MSLLTAIFIFLSTWLLIIIISLSIGKGGTKGSKPVQGVSLTYSYNDENTEQNTVATNTAILQLLQVQNLTYKTNNIYLP